MDDRIESEAPLIIRTPAIWAWKIDTTPGIIWQIRIEPTTPATPPAESPRHSHHWSGRGSKVFDDIYLLAGSYRVTSILSNTTDSFITMIPAEADDNDPGYRWPTNSYITTVILHIDESDIWYCSIDTPSGTDWQLHIEPLTS